MKLIKINKRKKEEQKMKKNTWTLVILTTVVAVVMMGGCQTATKSEGTKTPEVKTTKTEPVNEINGKVVSTGNFEGKSDHKTSGQVTLEKTEKGYQVVLGKDFDFDGAPAPVLALGKDGYKKEAKLGELKANKGRQVYEIPSSIAAEKHNEVWLWCTKVDAPLGVAKLPAGS